MEEEDKRIHSRAEAMQTLAATRWGPNAKSGSTVTVTVTVTVSNLRWRAMW